MSAQDQLSVLDLRTAIQQSRGEVSRAQTVEDLREQLSLFMALMLDYLPDPDQDYPALR